MSKKQSEFEQEYGERDGSVSPELHLASEDDKLLVEIKAEDHKILKSPEKESFDEIAVIAKFFKDILKPSERQREDFDLNPEDFKIYVELPKDIFTDEWQVACEKGPGGFFKVKKDEVENESLRKFIPKLKVKGEEYNGEDQEE